MIVEGREQRRGWNGIINLSKWEPTQMDCEFQALRSEIWLKATCWVQFGSW